MFRLDAAKTACLIVDVQEKIYPLMFEPLELLDKLKLMIQAAQLLNLPLVTTEQYPKGLYHTIQALKDLLGPSQHYFTKTTFSACQDPTIREALKQEQWILLGIEAHVCIQQTAYDLIQMGKQVVVISQAISSRSIYDYSTAIAEMRDMGARIASCEAVLFELLGDSKHPQFKAISQLIK